MICWGILSLSSEEGRREGGVEGGPVGEDGGVEELVTLRVHPAKGDEHAGSFW